MKRNIQNLFIRADSNPQIGTGHVMRCIALAQAWQDRGGGVTFLSHCENNEIKQRIQDEGFDFIPVEKPHPNPSDLTFVLNTLSSISYEPSASNLWLALDGYHFTPEYQKAIRDAGVGLLVIDDINHLPQYYADILLNQNIHAPNLRYHCDADTTILLGTSYVLLRREFLKYQDWKRKIPEKAKKILVTLGGSDQNNITFKVIEALKLINDPDLEVKVVVGPSNPHMASLKEAFHLSPFTFHLLSSSKNMAELMAWADISVSAGGSTCWEMAFLGLPNMITILSENQEAISEGLSEKGIAVNLGEYEYLTSDKITETFNELLSARKVRSRMSRLGKNLVDGLGEKRVVKSMIIGHLTLRTVQEKDCELIWKWANDPDVRAGSFFSEFIPWDDHVRWFNSKLNDLNCFFYIAMNERRVPIGQVRFDNNGKETLISVSLDKKFRGRGYGSRIIELASQEFFMVSNDKVVHAYIKQGNNTSNKAFLLAGFKRVGKTNICGQSAIHLVL
jgi:UDP-2,4-diacetamido-2,4,6-trideoxy-beta-L-altropyranose hydrolase